MSGNYPAATHRTPKPSRPVARALAHQRPGARRLAKTLGLARRQPIQRSEETQNEETP